MGSIISQAQVGEAPTDNVQTYFLQRRPSHKGIMYPFASHFGLHFESHRMPLTDLDGHHRVSHVSPDSPAHDAGVSVGSIILAVNGYCLTEDESASKVIEHVLKQPGSACLWIVTKSTPNISLGAGYFAFPSLLETLSSPVVSWDTILPPCNFRRGLNVSGNDVASLHSLRPATALGVQLKGNLGDTTVRRRRLWLHECSNSPSLMLFPGVEIVAVDGSAIIDICDIQPQVLSATKALQAAFEEIFPESNQEIIRCRRFRTVQQVTVSSRPITLPVPDASYLHVTWVCRTAPGKPWPLAINAQGVIFSLNHPTGDRLRGGVIVAVDYIAINRCGTPGTRPVTDQITTALKRHNDSLTNCMLTVLLQPSFALPIAPLDAKSKQEFTTSKIMRFAIQKEILPRELSEFIGRYQTSLWVDLCDPLTLSTLWGFDSDSVKIVTNNACPTWVVNSNEKSPTRSASLKETEEAHRSSAKETAETYSDTVVEKAVATYTTVPTRNAQTERQDSVLHALLGSDTEEGNDVDNGLEQEEATTTFVHPTDPEAEDMASAVQRFRTQDQKNAIRQDSVLAALDNDTESTTSSSDGSPN